MCFLERVRNKVGELKIFSLCKFYKGYLRDRSKGFGNRLFVV